MYKNIHVLNVRAKFFVGAPQKYFNMIINISRITVVYIDVSQNSPKFLIYIHTT